MGRAFQAAAEHIHAQYRYDGFDAAVMEVGQNDVVRFIECLQLTLLERVVRV